MPRRERLPKPDRRRALELLALCRDGCTEAIHWANANEPKLKPTRSGVHSRRPIRPYACTNLPQAVTKPSEDTKSRTCQWSETKAAADL
jgi:hypothetical protein